MEKNNSSLTINFLPGEEEIIAGALIYISKQRKTATHLTAGTEAGYTGVPDSTDIAGGDASVVETPKRVRRTQNTNLPKEPEQEATSQKQEQEADIEHKENTTEDVPFEDDPPAETKARRGRRVRKEPALDENVPPMPTGENLPRHQRPPGSPLTHDDVRNYMGEVISLKGDDAREKIIAELGRLKVRSTGMLSEDQLQPMYDFLSSL